MNRVEYFNKMGEINHQISDLVNQKVELDRKICSLETKRYELKQAPLTGSILNEPLKKKYTVIDASDLQCGATCDTCNTTLTYNGLRLISEVRDSEGEVIYSNCVCLKCGSNVRVYND